MECSRTELAVAFQALETRDDELDEFDEDEISLASTTDDDDESSDVSKSDADDNEKSESGSEKSKKKSKDGETTRGKTRRRAMMLESSESSEEARDSPKPASRRYSCSRFNDLINQKTIYCLFCCMFSTRRQAAEAKVNGDVGDTTESYKSSPAVSEAGDKAKVLGGEVIRKWKSTSRHGGTGARTGAVA